MRCSAGAKQNSKNCNWELKQARTKKQARHLLYYQFELQLASDTPNRAGTHKKACLKHDHDHGPRARALQRTAARWHPWPWHWHHWHQLHAAPPSRIASR
jgi:hypothetical protein